MAVSPIILHLPLVRSTLLNETFLYVVVVLAALFFECGLRMHRDLEVPNPGDEDMAEWEMCLC